MKQILPVSLIIPIRENQEDSINRLAQAIYDQTAWPAEIIVVNADSDDSGSVDFNFSNRFDGSLKIKVVDAPHAYPGKARNLGIENANQAFLAFLDLMTIPSPTWLKKSWELINQDNSDGMIGSCQFIGRNFFSWILIDSLFGRGSVSSLPGSLFTADGFRKVGPMIEKVRAGEDNEWMQRSQLIEVNLLTAPKETGCCYLGFQNITFREFCRKWIRNYWDAAKLPQYKLISQFNLMLWFLLIVSVAMNWNSVFAEWDTTHPLYVPHISKISFFSVVGMYLIFRAIYLPIKRGSSYRNVIGYRTPLIAVTAITADTIKSVIFLVSHCRIRVNFSS